MNAVSLLKSDHRKVESLFERYRATSNGKAEIIREITRELSMHMDAEEREVYPVFRKSIPDGESLMEDAVTEHEEARGLLAELARAEEGSFDTDAKMATLRRAIDHHVKDEEQTIFPEAQKSLGKHALEELGARIEKAKRSAPERPPSSAARKSPGSSVGGILAAATDRVVNMLTPDERRPPRRASRGKPTRKVSSRTKAAGGRAKKKARTTRKRTTAARTRRAVTKSRARKRIARGRG